MTRIKTIPLEVVWMPPLEQDLEEAQQEHPDLTFEIVDQGGPGTSPKIVVSGEETEVMLYLMHDYEPDAEDHQELIDTSAPE